MEHPLFPGRIERAAALGEFKRAGSSDPDVLQSVKVSIARPHRSAVGYGWALIGCGLLLCLTILGIPAGLALAVMGWWVLARARKNVRLVDDVLAEYVATTKP